jgi:hypothetical protein
MEQIEIRSEKVRNFIGGIPPFLIRLGNLLIFSLLIIFFIIGNLIKIPNTLSCEVQIIREQNDDTIQLVIVSVTKIITKPIETGKSVKIYKDGVLLYNGTLNKQLDMIRILPDTLQVFLPVSLTDTIITKEQMHLFLENNTRLICEIEIETQSLIKSIFRSLL